MEGDKHRQGKGVGGERERESQDQDRQDLDHQERKGVTVGFPRLSKIMRPFTSVMADMLRTPHLVGGKTRQDKTRQDRTGVKT